jgi:hypothetical protein
MGQGLNQIAGILKKNKQAISGMNNMSFSTPHKYTVIVALAYKITKQSTVFHYNSSKK